MQQFYSLGWESYSSSSCRLRSFFLAMINPFIRSPCVSPKPAPIFVSVCHCAATPGSSLPSRNSREAPPPVEMWLILSAKPSWFTAAAESPPPMMVVASVSASALATAMVPFARVRVLEYAHRSVPNNGLSSLNSLCDTVLQFSVRYPGLSCQQGYRQHQHTQPGSQHRSGSGKHQLLLQSTGRSSFLPSFSAFSIISLQ